MKRFFRVGLQMSDFVLDHFNLKRVNTLKQQNQKNRELKNKYENVYVLSLVGKW